MTIINTAVLKSAIKLLSSGIGTDQALEGSDSLLFAGSAVHSYNGSVSVSVPLKDSNGNPVDLHGCVKANTFGAWVSKLKGDTVSFATQPDGSWEVVSGKSRLYPTPFADPLTIHLEALSLASLEWRDLPEGFHGLMALMRLDNQKSNVPYVLFNGTMAMATDGVRTNSADFPEDMGNFAMHTDDLKAVLQTADLRQISVSGAWVHFLTDAGIVWTVRKMDGSQYRVTNHENMLKKVEDLIASGDPRNIATDLPEDTGDAVDKLGVYAVSDKEGTTRVDLHIKTSGLTMKAARTEGKAREDLDWPTPLPEGVDAELAVSGPFLKEASARSLKLHIVYSDGKAKDGTAVTYNALVFRGVNFTQIVRTLSH